MSGYTVTITPAGGQGGPQTTIQVDTTTGTARVVELTMRSAGGDGLAPQQLPVIDLVGLIAALTPTSAPAITATATEVATTEPVSAPAGRRRRATKARGATKATPKKSTATRARRRSKAAEAEPAKAGRAYRRMPDQDEVVNVFQSSGSVRAVAEHYGVPRHTATGWLRRLRSMGVLAS